MINIQPANSVVLRCIPELEYEIGEKPARLLLQIEYWIRISSTEERDGKRWTYQSTKDMQDKAFKRWSLSTINRAVLKLESLGLIHIGNFNSAKYDKTRWFALNVEGLGQLKSIILGQDEQRSSQNELGSMQNEQRSSHSEEPIPEITTENSSKTSTEIQTTTPAPDVVVVSKSITIPENLLPLKQIQPERPDPRPTQADNEGADELMESADWQPAKPIPPVSARPPSERHRWGAFFNCSSNSELEAIERQHGAEVVEAWMTQAATMGLENPPGFVITRLKKGVMPYALAQPNISHHEQDGTRYIKGKYADIIEH